MKENKCLLIDADSLAYYEMRKDTLEEGMHGIDNRINYMLSKTGIYSFILCLSNKSFRIKAAKTKQYKANRKPNPFIILPSLLKYMEVEYSALKVPLMEADDIVTYLKNSDPEKYVIASSDKDVLYQNIGDHYNYQKDEIISVTPEDAKYFLWYQMLVGDSTDNIPGVEGIGPVKAEKILKEEGKDYKTLVLETYIKKYGYLDGVNKFSENFNLVYMLRTEDEIKSFVDIDIPSILKEHTMNFNYLNTNE